MVTTYRLTEHHTAGGMSRWLPYLSELQPEFFCEVSPELAAERGLEHLRLGDDRHRPHRDRGPGAGHRADAAADRRRAGRCTRSGCPTTGARTASATGDAANDLLADQPRPERAHPGGQGVRRATSGPAGGRAGRGRPALVAEYRRRAGITEQTGTEPVTDGSTCRSAQRPEPGGWTSYAGAPPRMGFFTDTSVCIGCKACEVACKEWNHVPEDGLTLTGMSYDNTVGLGADTWRHVAFIEQRAPATVADGAGRARRPATRPASRPAARAALADGVRRLQALHARRLPRRVPDRGAVPHRVRHRRRAGGRLQRLRLLRPGLPVRRHRPARGRRPGVEVHAVLRPARGRAWSRPAPRPARPSRSSSGRSTSCASGPRRGWTSCTRRARPAPGSTATTRTTASAATARSSCCSTSPRSTACRRTRW